MGEVDTAPEVAAKVIEDLTALEVDPDKGERLFKAALVQSQSGTTYRMLAKVAKTGKVDLVHYCCELDVDGKPTTKWKIRRILEQAPERFTKSSRPSRRGSRTMVKSCKAHGCRYERHPGRGGPGREFGRVVPEHPRRGRKKSS